MTFLGVSRSLLLIMVANHFIADGRMNCIEEFLMSSRQFKVMLGRRESDPRQFTSHDQFSVKSKELGVLFTKGSNADPDPDVRGQSQVGCTEV